MVFAAWLPLGLAQTPASSRIVRGQVLDAEGKAVERAIVHLKNETTKETLSVVTDKEGRYQFNDVHMKTDYKVYAEWREQKSRARGLSQFDTRPLVVIHLRLEPPDQEKKDEGKDEGEKKTKEEKD